MNPRKAGESVDFDVDGETRSIPVLRYGSPKSMAATDVDVSVVFVPAAARQGRKRDGDPTWACRSWSSSPRASPVADTAVFTAYALQKGTPRTLGPNCPGVISPGQS